MVACLERFGLDDSMYGLLNRFEAKDHQSWTIQPGIVHAPGPRLTLEMQRAQDDSMLLAWRMGERWDDPHHAHHHPTDAAAIGGRRDGSDDGGNGDKQDTAGAPPGSREELVRREMLKGGLADEKALLDATVDWPANVDPGFGARWCWDREPIDSSSSSNNSSNSSRSSSSSTNNNTDLTSVSPQEAQNTGGDDHAGHDEEEDRGCERHRIFFDQFRGESIELHPGGRCRLAKDTRPFSGVVWAGSGTVNGQPIAAEWVRGGGAPAPGAIEESGSTSSGADSNTQQQEYGMSPAPQEFLVAPNVADTVFEASEDGDGLLVYLMYPIEEWE